VADFDSLFSILTKMTMTTLTATCTTLEKVEWFLP
jgi:hypothetical protein